MVEGAGRSNPSAAFGTRIVAGGSFTGCSTGVASMNSSANAVVVIGDNAYTISGGLVGGNTFGSRLANVTVDANYVLGASCIEFQNAQEQSGIEHVNCVNYSRFGIWVHGPKSNNSHIVDAEVNGCLVATSCIISSATIPVEIDTTIFRSVDGLTVNAVSTQSAAISPSPGSSKPWSTGAATPSSLNTNPTKNACTPPSTKKKTPTTTRAYRTSSTSPDLADVVVFQS